MISANPQLRVLLFGGFEVWSGDRPLRGFESQKVRALFAYLALQRDRALARDHLAALLWGDKDDESARRNLRQALYNLKATLPVAPDGGGRPHLVVEAQEVRFDGDSSYWLDVEAFEEGVGLAGDGGTGFHQLAGAVQLYRGDLLAGFQVKDCAEFEEWLVAAQERLRESALEALRRLVAGYLHRQGTPLIAPPRGVPRTVEMRCARRYHYRIFDLNDEGWGRRRSAGGTAPRRA